jgi:hypothetical protein
MEEFLKYIQITYVGEGYYRASCTWPKCWYVSTPKQFRGEVETQHRIHFKAKHEGMKHV